MAVDESESGETKEKNVVVPEQDVISISQEHELFDGGQDSSDSSSMFSSEASLEVHTESEAQSVGFTSLSEEEQKGATNDPTIVESCVNPPQEGSSSKTEMNDPSDKASMISNEPKVSSLREDEGASSTAELEDPSDKASLINNEPRVASFGEAQGPMPEQETCTSKEPIQPASDPPLSSVKPDHVENVGQEKMVGTKELQQDKTKPSVGNAKPRKPALNRVNSSGSDTSSYSFAFPILVPGVPQRAPRKTEGINPQGRVSLSLDDPDLDGENSISRPSPRPPSQKKSFCCCFCCFPCHSIFSSCFKCSSSY